jgi:hypothetical protein
MNKDKALDLALEALELTWDSGMPHPNIMQVGKAITAIKQARSAPVQEPHKGLSEHMMQATNGRVRIDPVTGNAGIGNPPAAQRQWVSLTTDERYDIRASFRGRFLETSEFAEQVQLATEARLKEKNNG